MTLTMFSRYSQIKLFVYKLIWGAFLLTFTQKNPSEFLVEQRVKSNKHEQQAKSNELKITSSEQNVTSDEQKVKSSDQKLTSNKQKLTSNEQNVSTLKLTISSLKNVRELKEISARCVSPRFLAPRL